MTNLIGCQNIFFITNCLAMEPPTTHTINSNIKPFSYVNSTQCLELIDQYISDEVDYKSTHIPFLKQISISYQQPPVIPCYPFDICQTYQVCINNSQLSNYKGSINKKDIRKKDRNACKKVNLYAFNCLQSLVPSKDLRGIKKFIHRADFFMTVLVIAQNLNIWSDFQSLYRVKQSVEGHKIKQMMKQKDVQYCFKKSLTCMKIFETGDIESAINELFDVKTLKCKAYLSESKERIRNLFGLSNEESIQQQYVKKRIIKKLMSSDFNN